MNARPRFSDTLEAMLTAPPRRRRGGGSLTRLATLLMLLAVGGFAVAANATGHDDVIIDGGAANAQGNNPTAGQIGAGTLMFHSATGQVSAPLLDTEVQIKVSGMVSRVTVTQKFTNPGSEFVEGVYLFPLPDDSAVDELKMVIGQRVIVGEIQEKEQARKTYTEAKRSGQRASLVEQKRPNMFTTNVANIGPGEQIEVQIGYLQTLRYVQGEFSLRFPMTITPRFDPPQLAAIGTALEHGLTDDQPYDNCLFGACNEAELRIELDAGFPLARVESLYHEMNIAHAGNQYLLTPVNGSVPMNRDFELVWQPALGANAEAAMFTETWDGEPFAMIMLLPPSAASLKTAQPREVVLVIDTSGSMGGTSIKQARAALRFALSRLQPQDRFNIVRFASGARAMFADAVPADPGNLLHAERYVDSLKSNGGTNIGAALDIVLDAKADQRASNDGFLRQVVFITDGSVGNEAALFKHIQSRLGSTRLFTVGIGSAPNDWFMRKAAQFGRGTFTHIGADHMIEERMEKLLTRLESPALKDIEIQAPPGAELWPERIQDLYVGEPVFVRARLQSLQGQFTVRAANAHMPWERTLSLTAGKDHPGIAALWGRGRIESLLDTVVTGADQDTVREQVIELALHHHLVSRFTSLVAVDKTPVRAVGTPLLTRKVPLAAPHGSAMLGYPAGATPAGILALAGFLTLLLGLAVRLFDTRLLRRSRPGVAGRQYWTWL